jgi:hypothetical protein
MQSKWLSSHAIGDSRRQSSKRDWSSALQAFRGMEHQRSAELPCRRKCGAQDSLNSNQQRRDMNSRSVSHSYTHFTVVIPDLLAIVKFQSSPGEIPMDSRQLSPSLCRLELCVLPFQVCNSCSCTSSISRLIFSNLCFWISSVCA